MRISGFIFLLLFSLSVLGQSGDIPDLNKDIHKKLEKLIGTRVARGECWDLANKLLTRVDAEWNHKFKYGKKIDPQNDKVYPGDMIQFENVELSYKKGNKIIKESYGQHTAVVYKVLDKGVYKIAHQNNGFSGKKVGISKLNINKLRKGNLYFYRPVK